MSHIVCCGNQDRADDAAGLLVAQRLRALGLHPQVCSGDPCELIEAWSHAQKVIVIDAVVTGAPVGTIHRWNASDANFCGGSSSSTHGFGLREAIALARTLGRLPSELHIWGIEARQFAAGGTTSPEVLEAVEIVANTLAPHRVRTSQAAVL
jgi:hydrogenase maturation protease